jgi:hypothetical protein
VQREIANIYFLSDFIKENKDMALTNGVAKKKVFERYNFHCFDTIYFLKSEVRISFNSFVLLAALSIKANPNTGYLFISNSLINIGFQNL